MRFLIVDDHLMVAETIASLLSEFCALELVGICPTVSSAKELLLERRADLMLLDLMLPGESWQEAAEAFLKQNPSGAIVVLSANAAEFEPPSRFQASIVAVIDKTCGWQELLDQITAWVLRQPRPIRPLVLPAFQLSSLNERELRLLEALGRGALNREIAEELGLTVATVETYRKVIASKLGLSGKQLVRLAVLQRLLPH
jgi:DNA-binding NarL/FixJ family response regulator